MKNNNFRITTAKLAKICNVSQGTVDRALNNRSGISEKTKKHILDVAKEYGYYENTFLRDYSGCIGIIVFDVYNKYFAEVIMHLEEACRKAGFSLVVMFSKKDPQEEKACIEQLYYMGVKGIVLCPVNKGPDFAAYLSSFKVPVICIGNRVEGIAYVGIDDYQAMFHVTEHVIQKGYERIIYFAPVLEQTDDSNRYSQEMRYKGFRDAAIDFADALTATQMQQIKELVVSQRKTAIITPSDVYALQIHMALYGEKYGLIGFDNTALTDFSQIKLDSVECNTSNTASRVIDYILDPEKDTGEPVAYEIIHRGSL